MEKIHQLPFRARLTLAILYITALGVILTIIFISAARNFLAGIAIGFTLEIAMTIHLIHRA